MSVDPQALYGDATGSRVLEGNRDDVRHALDRWSAQAVDLDMPGSDGNPYGYVQTTLGDAVAVTGPATYVRGAKRTLRFEPSDGGGWAIDRTDLPEFLPINVSVNNVWTTVRNIVLCSGSPHNYMRMVEHIIALRLGMGLDNVTLRLASGDPPLFDRSSMDLVEAVDSVGIVPQSAPARYVTVKEPVSVAGPQGSVLTFLPHAEGPPRLFIDCAIDFCTAIGQQRLRCDVTPETFRRGAGARTNASLGMVIYCKTVGKLFADVRNLGYTKQNILIAGRRHYFGEPRMRLANGKSLEAVWHRTMLDLLAAISLMERGRFCGRVISYKSGHTLDYIMARLLYRHDLLEEVSAT